jgi:4a-hydroxytetrahydrobiopterin dehydratase
VPSVPRLLGPDEVEAGLRDGLTRWSVDDASIVRSVEAASFLSGIALVDAVAQVAESLDHHPDIDIRWTSVTFRLSTHSAGGITDNDLGLARRIEALAAEG